MPANIASSRRPARGDTPPPGPGKRQPLGIFLTDSVQTLIEGTKDFDIGNHHFPAIMRSVLCKRMAELTPDPLQYTVLGSSGINKMTVPKKARRTCARKGPATEKKYSFSPRWAWSKAIILGEMTAQEAMDMIAPEYQAALDEANK